MRLRDDHRGDRGDILVTPAILILGIAATLIVGGLAYVGARSVGGDVDNTRQGVTLDDDGNIVEAGVGVAPVPTKTPKPTDEPTDAPPVVRRTQAPVQHTPGPVVVHTSRPHRTEDPFETEEPDHDTPEPHETQDPHEQQDPH